MQANIDLPFPQSDLRKLAKWCHYYPAIDSVYLYDGFEERYALVFVRDEGASSEEFQKLSEWIDFRGFEALTEVKEKCCNGKDFNGDQWRCYLYDKNDEVKNDPFYFKDSDGLLICSRQSPSTNGHEEALVFENTRPQNENNFIGSFVRNGDFWNLTFEGKHTLLKTMKGIKDLAALLDNPNKKFAPLELDGILSAEPEVANDDPE